LRRGSHQLLNGPGAPVPTATGRTGIRSAGSSSIRREDSANLAPGAGAGGSAVGALPGLLAIPGARWDAAPAVIRTLPGEDFGATEAVFHVERLSIRTGRRDAAAARRRPAARSTLRRVPALRPHRSRAKLQQTQVVRRVNGARPCLRGSADCSVFHVKHFFRPAGTICLVRLQNYGK